MILDWTKGPTKARSVRATGGKEWVGLVLTKGSIISTNAAIRSWASSANISASESGRPMVKLLSRRRMMFGLFAS